MRRNTSIARNIWLQYHEYIPKDINGRSYEIHHIDGNCENNDINNLLAIPINMHYQIHLLQQDYVACNLIAERIEKPIIKGYKLPQLSDEIKQKMSKSAIIRFSKKEERENTSKSTKLAMKKPEVRKKVLENNKKVGNILTTYKTIYKETKEKRVAETEIQNYLNDGWKLGRCPIFKLGRKKIIN